MTQGAQTRIRRSREKIVTAAEAIFLRKGFLGTNMDEVATAAGVSKQTVYSHFGSKEALFLDVIEAMTGGSNAAIRPVFETPPEDRPVDAFLLDFATRQLTTVLTPRLMQLRRLVIGEAGRFPELGQALYENGPGHSIRWLAHSLEAYAGRGELVVPDPIEAARAFNWLVMGEPTNAAMFLGDAGIPGRAYLERHAAESVRIFLAAFGTGKS